MDEPARPCPNKVPMRPTPPHLQALEKIEEAGIPGLLEVLSEEGIDGVRYALWNASGGHRTTPLPPGGTGPPKNRSEWFRRWR